MQYKLKRYSDAIYPRKYNVGDPFTSESKGQGQIVDAKPHRDLLTKEKFWEHKVRFKTETGSDDFEIVKVPARDTAIVMFPNVSPDELPFPGQFPIASFRSDFASSLTDIKHGVVKVFQALKLEETHQEELHWWTSFLDSIPEDLSSVSHVQPFWIPNIHAGTHPAAGFVQRQNTVSGTTLEIDDGVRPVDVVTYEQFTAARCRKALTARAGMRDYCWQSSGRTLPR